MLAFVKNLFALLGALPEEAKWSEYSRSTSCGVSRTRWPKRGRDGLRVESLC